MIKCIDHTKILKYNHFLCNYYQHYYRLWLNVYVSWIYNSFLYPYLRIYSGSIQISFLLLFMIMIVDFKNADK
ncbi:hypothetical protein DERF_011340 [Dermatophagoides farinae]|uniref:Uncharacterized protein n=1 Tax=Dermatophagoides farinae TaxID=6954 RepID=A0A922HV77_DERFA|nr:hypothetical protein DERF_011340 [Dermatophagoides farinae]